MDNKPTNQLQLELTPEVATGHYSNFAVISHSSSEFVVDFATVLPGVQKAHVGTRAIMAPEHAVRLLHALQDNIMKYEQQFGKIQLPGSQPTRTIAPFSNGKGGEA